MEIAEEFSDAGSPTGALGAVPINKRTADTTVIVQDQQTVVIGGLVREGQVTGITKIPVLGDIPVLGVLFRQQQKQTQKTNLLLIITPHIVREQNDLRRIFERKMQERQEFLDRYFVFAGDDWEPPKDYVRTNGLVEDIRQAHFEIEERIRLEEESAPGERKRHEPSDAIELPAVSSPSKGAAAPKAAPKPAPAPKKPAPRRPRRSRPRGSLDTPLEDNKMARSVVVERTE
jgi:general secretion pathway protein D